MLYCDLSYEENKGNNGMRNCDPIGLAKAVLWEEAKGKLKAIVAAEGANISNVYTQGKCDIRS